VTCGGFGQIAGDGIAILDSLRARQVDGMILATLGYKMTSERGSGAEVPFVL